MNPLDINRRTLIVEGLLRWFAASQRSLPWRQRYSPYEIWISEVMLQQTQIKTVLPYYQRWMERFPDAPSIAEASEQEVLKYWEGMGYYLRARNILRAAKILADQYGGNVPDDYQAICRLPGIGRYTAAAIMSLAFNRDYGVVDGNVERVFARLFNLDEPVKAKESQAFIRGTVQLLMPQGQARDYNQAIMELGAVICVPRRPVCRDCPLMNCCDSNRLGIVSQRPVPGVKKATVPIKVALGVLVHDRQVLIQKRPDTGLMAGLWEFPGGKLESDETPQQALKREFLEELGLPVDPVRELAVIKHQYTSFRVELHCFLCHFSRRPRALRLNAAVQSRWVSPNELQQYPFPAANRKLITMLAEIPGSWDSSK
jgi:A/G-specific adenine glycosylase